MSAPLTRESAIQECLKVLDTDFFRALSEPTRVLLFRRLVELGRVDVQTIAAEMPQDVSVISRHLNLMEDAGVVRSNKQGRHRIYEVDAPAIVERLESIIAITRAMMPAGCLDPATTDEAHCPLCDSESR